MAEDLRKQVLDASRKLIAEVGLSGLSMREVARRAGVSHQAPYHHFADKESIVAALVQQGLSLFAERLEAAAERRGSVVQRLSAVGRAYVDFALEYPDYFRLIFRPEVVDLTRFPETKAAADRAFSVLERLVTEQLVSTKTTSRAQHAAMVSLHWSVVHGLSSLLLDGALGHQFPDAPSRVAHVEATLKIFRELMTARAQQ